MHHNQVVLLGHLASDVELRVTPKGTPVCNFRFATNRRFKTEGGEVREKRMFVDVEVWGKQAETCNKHLHSGSRAFLTGTLDMDEWEDKNTKEKRSKLKVSVDWRSGGTVQILDWEGDGAGDEADDRRESEPEPEPAPRRGNSRKRTPAGTSA